MLQNQVQDDGKSCGEGLVNLDKKIDCYLSLVIEWLWKIFEKYQKMSQYSLCTWFWPSLTPYDKNQVVGL